MSKWELDDEMLWYKMTKDESIPKDPELIVPIIYREPDIPPIAAAPQKQSALHADATGLPPMRNEGQGPGGIGNLSVSGDYRIKLVEKIKICRKCGKIFILWTIENTKPCSKPTDAIQAPRRPNWSK